MAAAESLPVINPDFSAVAVECSHGYAYETPVGGCNDVAFPKQNFSDTPGMGWKFGSHFAPQMFRDGVTKPNTPFDPPPFPPQFRQAAFLQLASFVYQTIPGFVSGGRYTVSFYLGSRYAEGFGDQHVRVILGGVVIYDKTLQSSMPFTRIDCPFVAPVSGPLTLVFEGIVTAGDQTAFFSGVGIEFDGVQGHGTR